MCKLYEIQISLSINKVLLAHSYDHSFMHCKVTDFETQGQSWVIASGSQSLTCLLPGSLQQKLADPRYKE